MNWNHKSHFIWDLSNDSLQKSFKNNVNRINLKGDENENEYDSKTKGGEKEN